MRILLVAVAIGLPPPALGIGFGCPQHLVQMAAFNYSYMRTTVPLFVCEDLSSANGSITFAQAAGSPPLADFPLTLRKRVYTNAPDGKDDDDRIYLANYSKRAVLAAETDVMGNLLLGIHGNSPRKAEVTLDEVTALGIPPLRTFSSVGNGIPRVWTANRESGRDITFDGTAYNHLSGTPGPMQAARLLPGIASSFFDAEGSKREWGGRSGIKMGDGGIRRAGKEESG